MGIAGAFHACAPRIGRPPGTDLRAVMNAILYIGFDRFPMASITQGISAVLDCAELSMNGRATAGSRRSTVRYAEHNSHLTVELHPILTGHRA